LDSLVKERLTGAIILVVLIVLLVPELLSGPSRSAPVPLQGAAAVAASEEPPLRSYTINLADESHTAAAAAATSSASPQASGPAQPTAIVEPPTAQQVTAGSAADSAEQTDGSTQPAIPATTTGPQELTTQQPSTQRDAAATATPQAGQRDAAPDEPPMEERAAAPAKSSTVRDWMVQLGVFRNHANAERLAQQLKGQGFQVLISESGSGGHPFWRVRAGPVAERALAEQLNARLRTAGHTGSVVPK
jgi:DedD protein